MRLPPRFAPRNDNKPQQYIKGCVEFYKLKFKVTPDVLIPRPETELLVDEVLKYVHGSQFTVIRTNYEQTNQLTILDLGTGAGNIAISLACSASGASSVKIIAADISQKALQVAKLNARLHGVLDKIRFTKSNLLSDIHTEPDIIVANLPYIPSARIPFLDSSVKDFEPHIALDGGEDGFKLYRRLFEQIKEKGWSPKLIVEEIDYTHRETAYNEAYKYFPKAHIEVKKDLAHLQRILTIRFST